MLQRLPVGPAAALTPVFIMATMISLLAQATDLTAVVTKLKGAGVEAVVNWSIVPAQAIVPKNMKQLGMKIPLFQCHGFGNPKYIKAAGDSAAGIIFPSSSAKSCGGVDHSPR